MKKREKRMFSVDEVKEFIDTIYQCGVCALCQCDDNAEGMFPCNCDCDQTEKRAKVLKMLLDTRNELVKQIENEQ
jgi:hypothetical protein